MLWQFLTGNLWRTAAIALALLLGAQTIRADHSQALYRTEKAAHNETKATYREAQAQAELRARAAKEATEEHYRQLAERADREADKAISDARAAAQRYIDRMRLKAAPGAPVGPSPGPDSGDPAVREGMPPDPVVVSAADLQAMAEWVAYGIAVREWAMGLANVTD